MRRELKEENRGGGEGERGEESQRRWRREGRGEKQACTPISWKEAPESSPTAVAQPHICLPLSVGAVPVKQSQNNGNTSPTLQDLGLCKGSFPVHRNPPVQKRLWAPHGGDLIRHGQFMVEDSGLLLGGRAPFPHCSAKVRAREPVPPGQLYCHSMTLVQVWPGSHRSSSPQLVAGKSEPHG